MPLSKLYVTPLVGFVTVIVPVAVVHVGCAALAVGAAGVGLTVIVNDCGVPVQPFAVGVTVIVAVMGDELELLAANAAISPEPLAAKPMPGVLFVQLYVVPATAEPVKVIIDVLVLLQTV